MLCFQVRQFYQIRAMFLSSLPSAIEDLEEKINSQREAGLSQIRQQVSDTAQMRREGLVYGKFSHQMYVP